MKATVDAILLLVRKANKCKEVSSIGTSKASGGQVLVLLDHKSAMVLIDLGAMVFSYTQKVSVAWLKIHAMDDFLKIEGKGGFLIPHVSYVRINAKIPKIPSYQEDVLLLVSSNSKYGWRVHVHIRTQIIGKVLSTITPKELRKANEAWCLVYFSSVITNRVNTTDINALSTTEITGNVVTTKLVKVLPLGSLEEKGLTEIKGHSE